MIRFVLLLTMLASIHAQDKFIQKYTFAKTMSQCFGTSAYQNYLYRIADAKRECGYQGFNRLYPDQDLYTSRRPIYSTNTVNYPPYGSGRPFFGGSDRPFSGSQATSPPISVILPGRNPALPRGRPTINELPPLRLDFLKSAKQTSGGFYPNRELYDREIVRETMERVSGALRNFTCVLASLDLIDPALNINYDMITSNYYQSNMDAQLRNDLVDGVNYCRQLNSCLPEDKSPISHELQRVMAFIKCEKRTRLGACFKHDLRNNIHQFDVSALPDDGSFTTDLEKLMTIIIGSESLDQLELY